MHRSVVRSFVLGLFLLIASTAAPALTIDAAFTNTAGQTWTADRQSIVYQAISEWENIILDDQLVSIEFDFTNAGTEDTYLGQWSLSYSYYNGDDLRPWSTGMDHTIHLNADLMDETAGNYLWFDPTPASDDDQPFEAWDALTVLRHELAHALGFTAGTYVDNKGTTEEVTLWDRHIDASNIFDPDGLGVSMYGTDWGHVADSGATTDDLMTPSLTNGERRPISATNVAMMATAYNYDVVPEPATLGVLAVGGVALIARRRRRKVA